MGFWEKKRKKEGSRTTFSQLREDPNRKPDTGKQSGRSDRWCDLGGSAAFSVAARPKKSTNSTLGDPAISELTQKIEKFFGGESTRAPMN